MARMADPRLRIAAPLIAAALVASAAAAQVALPAEFPPSSFTGLQYVDSRGCAFVRTGAGDLVTWVPRLTRRREQVCGLTPSLSGVPVPDGAAAPQEVEAVMLTLTPTPIPVPQGYRPAWADDRLNPYRARGTAAGEAAMNGKWSATIPRRMIGPGS